MAILVVLTGIAVVAMRPTATRARQAARGVVEAQVVRARSHAVATGQPTALVFAGYGASAAIAGRAMALVEVEWNETEAGWRAKRVLSRWEVLPGKVVFLNGVASDGGVTVMDGGRELVVPGQAGAGGPYVLFGAGGGVEWPAAGSMIRVALGSGVVRGGRVEATERAPDGSAVHDVLQVNRLTGRTRVVLESQG